MSHKKVRNKYCIAHYYVGIQLVMRNKRTSRNPALAARRPFSSAWQAATLLDCSARRVYESVQEGRLPLAFDIGRPGSSRVCLRMATAAVIALQRRLPPPSDLEAFLAEALPDGQVSFKATHVARMLQCDSDHIYRLISEKVLEDIGGRIHYRVPRDSLVRFLKERRVK